MTLPRPWLPITAVALAGTLAAGLSGCGSAASPKVADTGAGQGAQAQSEPATPEGAPDLASGPVVSAMSGKIAYRKAGAAQSAELDVEGSESAGAGDTVQVEEGGLGLINWVGHFSAELVAGSEAGVVAVDPAKTRLTLDAGTARYGLPADGAHGLEIEAGGVTISSEAAGADLIVAHDGDTVWLAVLKGTGAVRGPSPVASVSAADTPEQVVHAGEALAIGSDAAERVVPVAVDLDAVKRWYLGLASGTLLRPVHEVAFRCRVAEGGADLVYDPVQDLAAADVLESLEPNALLSVIARESDGDWLHVVALESDTEGWVQVHAVGCLAPLALLESESALVKMAAEPAPIPIAAGQAGAPAAPTATPAGQPSSSGGEGDANSGDGSGASDSNVPTNAPSAAPPTPTVCETDCEIDGPPTETPRPPRPTREATQQQPAPTNPPPEATDPPAPPTSQPPPTDAPAQPTDAPPEPTEAPPQPTDPPPAATDAPEPPPEPTDGAGAALLPVSIVRPL